MNTFEINSTRGSNLAECKLSVLYYIYVSLLTSRLHYVLKISGLKRISSKNYQKQQNMTG